jgi:protein-disulfide isomerase
MEILMKMWKLGLIVSLMAAVMMGGMGIAFSQSAGQPRLVRGNEPARGRADAPVTVVVFCDFQCPLCASMAPSLQRLTTDYPVRVVYRNFPVQRVHPDAVRAAEAAACAQDQGRFWDMYNSMLANPGELSESGILRQAGDLGLDTRAFDRCLFTDRHEADVRLDQADGRALGVTGTPTLFVNGAFAEGLRSYDQLAALVRSALGR